MKNKLVKALGLVLASSMLAGCLTGCGSEKNEVSNEVSKQESSVEKTVASESKVEEPVNAVAKEGYPIVAEPETLSVVAGFVNVVSSAVDSEIQVEIAELTNVDVEWEIIEATSREEKKGLIAARKELPDVLLEVGYADPEYLNMIDAGQLVAIDEYLEYAPNFSKILETHDGLREAITASDGHIYAFPYSTGYGAETYSCMVNNVTYINQDWLDKLGLEMPKTTDDLKTVLKAFVTKDPNGNGLADEVGITCKGNFDDWFGAFGIVPSANEVNMRNLTVMDGKAAYAPAQEEYRAALDFFHELWEEGLIDPEAFTQDSSMLGAKMKAETRVAGMFECWRGTSWRLSNEDTAYSILPVLSGPDGDQLYPQRFSGLTNRAGAMITKDCENIELAMRWIDTFCDPKYSYQFWTDLREGYHYEVKDGVVVDIKAPDKSNPAEDAMVDLKFVCVDKDTMASKPKTDDPFNVDNEKAVSDAMYAPYFPEEHYPNIFLKVEESSRVAEISTDLTLYMDQFYADWIINGGDDAAWNSHLEQLDKLGVDEFVKIYQDAWDRVK